jgi:hypothetical protein
MRQKDLPTGARLLRHGGMLFAGRDGRYKSTGVTRSYASITEDEDGHRRRTYREWLLRSNRGHRYPHPATLSPPSQDWGHTLVMVIAGVVEN